MNKHDAAVVDLMHASSVIQSWILVHCASLTFSLSATRSVMYFELAELNISSFESCSVSSSRLFLPCIGWEHATVCSMQPCFALLLRDHNDGSHFALCFRCLLCFHFLKSNLLVFKFLILWPSSRLLWALLVFILSCSAVFALSYILFAGQYFKQKGKH
jgi:hypothetical protein